MLSQEVKRYVALQRVLGYKFEPQSHSLQQFADYAMSQGDTFIRVDRVLAWATKQTPSAQHRQTLVVRVRRFALALHAEDPQHEVPPRDCVGHARMVRRAPYIYSAEEIDWIMRTAGQMPAKGFIAPLTLSTLLGLLASTGLRISEVLSLQLSDIGEDGLIIRKSKFGKSRLIPMHETTEAALEQYVAMRARQPVFTQAVFVSRCGQALIYKTVFGVFRRLLTRAGLKPGSAPNHGPRIHDFRHTFAVRSLEQCQTDRKAVALHMVALSAYLGHANVTDTYWYLEGTPIIMREYLPRDRAASTHTCETYAYSLMLLLRFTAERLNVKPSQIDLPQIDVLLVLEFLTHIEKGRGNTARTRNARLGAIKSFFRYLEYREPHCLEQARQIHAIPLKKTDQALVSYLNREEVQALLDAPDTSTAVGLRDRAMLHVGYACGLRVSELVSLRLDHLDIRTPPSIRVMGKGRRERVLPLWKETTAAVKAWLKVRELDSAAAVFLNAGGREMTRAGFEYILDKHTRTAGNNQPSIATKRVTPHVLRHTCAMHILQATADIRKVSLWLGHASIQSTEIYLRADPTEKLDALAMGIPPTLKRGRFQVPDKLMAMFKDAKRPV
jgi:site-specific recombinase XerD